MNWFENNPVKSIITYTIFIIASTWAVFTFIVEENRINLIKTQLETKQTEVENYKSQVEQYKTKVELIQAEISLLRMENKEYKDWLYQSKDAIPIMVPKLIELENKLKVQKERNDVASKQIPNKRSFEITRGKGMFDEITNVSMSILEINPNRSASIKITTPDKETKNIDKIYAGEQIHFKFNKKDFILIILEISWIDDLIKCEIIEQ